MESYRKEEVKVGVLVLAALIVMGVLFGAVLGLRPGRKSTYQANFRRVAGLEKGSAVNYAGFQVGRVKSVRVDQERADTLRVVLTVDEDVRLPRGTVATIDAPMFGSTSLDLKPGDPAGGWLEDGAELASEEPFNLTAAMRKVESLVGKVEETVGVLSENLEGATEQVKSVLASVEQLLGEENRDHVGSLLAGADEMMEEMRPQVREVMAKIDSALTKLDQATDAARKTLERAQGLVEDNREDLERIVENALAALEKARSSMDNVDGILAGQRGNLEETIASLREASANMVELTRSLKERPWTLVRQTKPRGEGSPGGTPPGEAPAGAGVERKR